MQDGSELQVLGYSLLCQLGQLTLFGSDWEERESVEGAHLQPGHVVQGCIERVVDQEGAVTVQVGIC